MELGEGRVGVEPVEGLGDGDERDARVVEARGRGLAAAVLRGPARGAGLGQHVLVRVDADDGEAALGQEARQDAGAAADVGHAVARADTRLREDPVDERRGVGRAEPGVARGRAGESLPRVDGVHLRIVREDR